MPDKQSPPQYGWLRQIKRDLLTYDSVPLLGTPPEFPWKELSETLSKALSCENMAISPSEFRIRTANDLLDGLGTPYQQLNITITPLEGILHWVMAQQDIAQLISWFLKEQVTIRDKDISYGFYQYIAANAMHAITKLNATEKLTPRLSEESPLPEDHALCRDISLTFQEQTIWGRIIISPTLQESWKKYFSTIPLQKKQNLSIKKMELDVGVSIGHVNINKKQLSDIEAGDIVILDSYGEATIEIDGNILFKGKLLDKGIKIL